MSLGALKKADKNKTKRIGKNKQTIMHRHCARQARRNRKSKPEGKKTEPTK
jgi:hypothetical protein